MLTAEPDGRRSRTQRSGIDNMAKALLPIIDGGRGFSCSERRIFDGYLHQRRAAV